LSAEIVKLTGHLLNHGSLNGFGWTERHAELGASRSGC
jgi:hypothetical protein